MPRKIPIRLRRSQGVPGDGTLLDGETAVNMVDPSIYGGIGGFPRLLALPLSGGALSGPLYLPMAAPIATNEAAHKLYVDNMIAGLALDTAARYLPLTGGQLSGTLALPSGISYTGLPTGAPNFIGFSWAAGLIEAYVDGLFHYGTLATNEGVAAAYLPLSGGTLTGDLLLVNSATLWPGVYLVGTPLGGPRDLFIGMDAVSGIFQISDETNGRVLQTIDAAGAITFFGPVAVPADPINAMELATKQYVDAHVPAGGPFLPLAGGTLSGPLTVNSDLTALRMSAFGMISGAQWQIAGGWIGWNFTNGGAETDFFTSGPWPGGFNFYDVRSDAAAAPTLIASLDGLGNMSLAGTMTVAGDPLAPMEVATRAYVDAHAAEVPIVFVIGGPPRADGVVNVPITIGLNVPANLVGTRVYATTPATADTIFTLNLIRAGAATEIGTITILAGTDTAAALAGTGGALQSGDVLQLVAPATADATLADLGVTILTTRI